MVETSPGFIKWPTVVSFIVLKSYNDPTTEVGEQHSVSTAFVPVMWKLEGAPVLAPADTNSR